MFAWSPFQRKTCTVPGPVASKSNSAFVAFSFTLSSEMLSLGGAGSRPEIGTPSVADW